MDSTKFLGLCILVASFVIAGAIVWHANMTAANGRYQLLNNETQGFVGNPVRLDTKTGEVKSRDGLVLMPANQANQ